MSDREKRFERQEELVDRSRLEPLGWVTVVGVGAVGRQVAIQLAAVGVERIMLVDPDTVEAVNVTTQVYHYEDVGKPKVEATAELLTKIDPAVKLKAQKSRYRSQLGEDSSALFMCVDSIETREKYWESCGKNFAFWSDARMMGEVFRVLTTTKDDPKTAEYYGKSFFPEEEAVQGRCTARSTVYCAAGAACFMVHQFARFLRRQPVDCLVALNMTTSEIEVVEVPSPIKVTASNSAGESVAALR